MRPVMGGGSRGDVGVGSPEANGRRSRREGRSGPLPARGRGPGGALHSDAPAPIIEGRGTPAMPPTRTISEIRLVNGSTGDPSLFIDYPGRDDALLFDAGDNAAL